jgi:hypothetical protein
VLLVLVAAGWALAKGEKPIVVTVGNLRLTANGNFSPTLLPKNELAPITLNLSGKIRNPRSHPPTGDPGSHRRNRQERGNQREGAAGLHLGQTAGADDCQGQGDLLVGDHRRRHDQRRSRFPRTAALHHQK